MTKQHTMRRRLRQRKPVGGRVDNTEARGPWRDVAWIGISDKGPQGGQVWTLVLVCGHIAHRPFPQPTPYKMYRRWPSAPKRCRCLSCEIGTPKADPQGWIDILIARGYAP